MTPAPKRRWFSFSLRTLFVVVTVAAASCCWVSAQLNWIKERSEARKWITEHGLWGYNRWAVPQSAPLRPKLIERAPWSIRFFGEWAVEEIYLDPGLIPPKEMHNRANEMVRLFPEATIITNRTWVDPETKAITTRSRVLPTATH
jgi:hypothetical protein